MKRNFLAALIGAALCSSPVLAIEPMDEHSMGTVSLETGDNLLNVMGASAAGTEVSLDPTSADTSIGEINTSLTHGESTRGNMEGTAKNPIEYSLSSRQNDAINPDAPTYQFKIVAPNTLTGEINVSYDSQLHNINASSGTTGGLNIRQNSMIDQIQINNVRDHSGAAIRGSYTYTGLSVVNDVSISPK